MRTVYVGHNARAHELLISMRRIRSLIPRQPCPENDSQCFYDNTAQGFCSRNSVVTAGAPG